MSEPENFKNFYETNSFSSILWVAIWSFAILFDFSGLIDIKRRGAYSFLDNEFLWDSCLFVLS